MKVKEKTQTHIQSTLPQLAASSSQQGRWWHAGKELKTLGTFCLSNPHPHPILPTEVHILLHLCSLHCLSFTTSLSVYYPHSISLYLLLSFFHISLVVFIPTRPYMESGFICRLKQCWSASYRLEQTLTNADDYSEALMVDIGNTLHNIGSESLLLHIWLKRENELYLAWNVPHPDLWKCWLNTVLLSHDCYFRVF